MNSNHRSAALLLSAVRPPSKTTSTNSEALPSNARRYARNCYWPKSAPSVRCWPHSTTTQDSLVVGTREQVWWDDDVELYFDPDFDHRTYCQIGMNSIGTVSSGGMDCRWRHQCLRRRRLLVRRISPATRIS